MGGSDMAGLWPSQFMPKNTTVEWPECVACSRLPNKQVHWWVLRSLADDLVTGHGDVFSRAASTLRSVESQPLVGRLVSPLPVSLHSPAALGRFRRAAQSLGGQYHVHNITPITCDLCLASLLPVSLHSPAALGRFCRAAKSQTASSYTAQRLYFIRLVGFDRKTYRSSSKSSRNELTNIGLTTTSTTKDSFYGDIRLHY